MPIRRIIGNYHRPDYTTADVSDIQPFWIPHSSTTDVAERAVKRRRIEENARTYMLGGSLHIQSAGLKGPFDNKSWNNPWKTTGEHVQDRESVEKADPIQEESAEILLPPKKTVTNRQKPKARKAAKPKAKGKPPIRRRKPQESALPQLELAPPETNWLRKSTRKHDLDHVQLPEEATPTRSSKVLVSRSASPVKPKARPAPKRRATRKGTKAKQAQLPLGNVSKASQDDMSKKDHAQDQLDKPNYNEGLPTEAASVIPADAHEVGADLIRGALARIGEHLAQGKAKPDDRKRRFMTFSSPHAIKDSTSKQKSSGNPVTEKTRVSEPAKLSDMEVNHDPNVPTSDAPPTATNLHGIVTRPSFSAAPSTTSSGPSSSVLKLADEALQVIQQTTDTVPQSASNNVTSNSGTIMNDDPNEKPVEVPSVVQQALQEDSSEHIRVPSFPEHQESKAYSPSFEMTTQAAMIQAQLDFQAEFASDSPAAITPGPAFQAPAGPRPQITPFRTLRKSTRLSVNGLGSTQDLIQAAQAVNFDSARKEITAKKKRASFVEWIPQKGLSPPPGSDENQHPSNIPVAPTTSGPEQQKQYSVQQPSSQSRSIMKALRDISSQQSNSQQRLDIEPVLPIVSFMPSVAYSTGQQVSGAPAASWQMGQGQGQGVDEAEKSFDLERSLDEALDFLSVDFEL